MLLSALIAGPVGVATDAGELAAEKLTGLDPEIIGDRLLGAIGIHGPQTARTELATAEKIPAAPPKPAAPANTPWSDSQLAAYGVTAISGGDMKLGRLQGSDVLNSIELNRLQAQQAAVQYAATACSTAT